MSRPSTGWSCAAIEAFGHHGAFDAERRDGHVFLVDLMLSFNSREAARTDHLRERVDYGSLVARVKKAVSGTPST